MFQEDAVTVEGVMRLEMLGVTNNRNEAIWWDKLGSYCSAGGFLRSTQHATVSASPARAAKTEKVSAIYLQRPAVYSRDTKAEPPSGYWLAGR